MAKLIVSNYTGSKFRPEWLERTKLVASMIDPVSFVVDLGCGQEMLKEFLPEGCRYVGFDLPDLDLTGQYGDKIPAECTHQVLSGVLEWLPHPFVTIGQLSAPNVIVSYEPIVDNKELSGRKEAGWLSHIDEETVIYFFERTGYAPVNVKRWNRQLIWHMKKTITRTDVTDSIF